MTNVAMLRHGIDLGLKYKPVDPKYIYRTLHYPTCGIANLKPGEKSRATLIIILYEII